MLSDGSDYRGKDICILVACVAAGPRTRLNPLYSPCTNSQTLYTEGLERLRRRLHLGGISEVDTSLLIGLYGGRYGGPYPRLQTMLILELVDNAPCMRQRQTKQQTEGRSKA